MITTAARIAKIIEGKLECKNDKIFSCVSHLFFFPHFIHVILVKKKV
jgi:hypothetical protein